MKKFAKFLVLAMVLVLSFSAILLAACDPDDPEEEEFVLPELENVQKTEIDDEAMLAEMSALIDLGMQFNSSYIDTELYYPRDRALAEKILRGVIKTAESAGITQQQLSTIVGHAENIMGDILRIMRDGAEYLSTEGTIRAFLTDQKLVSDGLAALQYFASTLKAEHIFNLIADGFGEVLGIFEEAGDGTVYVFGAEYTYEELAAEGVDMSVFADSEAEYAWGFLMKWFEFALGEGDRNKESAYALNVILHSMLSVDIDAEELCESMGFWCDFVVEAIDNGDIMDVIMNNSNFTVRRLVPHINNVAKIIGKALDSVEHPEEFYAAFTKLFAQTNGMEQAFIQYIVNVDRLVETYPDLIALVREIVRFLEDLDTAVAGEILIDAQDLIAVINDRSLDPQTRTARIGSGIARLAGYLVPYIENLSQEQLDNIAALLGEMGMDYVSENLSALIAWAAAPDSLNEQQAFETSNQVANDLVKMMDGIDVRISLHDIIIDDIASQLNDGISSDILVVPVGCDLGAYVEQYLYGYVADYYWVIDSIQASADTSKEGYFDLNVNVGVRWLNGDGHSQSNFSFVFKGYALGSGNAQNFKLHNEYLRQITVERGATASEVMSQINMSYLNFFNEEDYMLVWTRSCSVQSITGLSTRTLGVHFATMHVDAGVFGVIDMPFAYYVEADDPADNVISGVDFFVNEYQVQGEPLSFSASPNFGNSFGQIDGEYVEARTEISGYNSNRTGMQSVTLSYESGGRVWSETFDVYVLSRADLGKLIKLEVDVESRIGIGALEDDALRGYARFAEDYAASNAWNYVGFGELKATLRDAGYELFTEGFAPDSVGEMRFDVVLEENGRELMRQTMVTTVYDVRVGQVEIKEDAVTLDRLVSMIGSLSLGSDLYPDAYLGGTIDDYTSAFDLMRNIASGEVSINGTNYTFGPNNNDYYSWCYYTQIDFGLDMPISVTDISELPQSVIAQYGEDYLLGAIENDNVYLADIKYTVSIYGARAYEGEIEVFIVG